MKPSVRMHQLADGQEVLRCREGVCSYCQDRRVAPRCRMRPDIVLVFDRESGPDEPGKADKEAM